MDTVKAICKNCELNREIHIGNVCNSCHVKFGDIKGTHGAANKRLTPNGLYCLKCKFIVPQECYVDSSGRVQSYCKKCRGSLASGGKKRNRYSKEVEETEEIEFSHTQRTKKAKTTKRIKKMKAKRVETSEITEEEEFAFIDDSDTTDKDESEYEEPVFKPVRSEEKPVELVVQQSVAAPVVQTDPYILIVGTCQHCNKHTKLQLPAFFIPRD